LLGVLLEVVAQPGEGLLAQSALLLGVEFAGVFALAGSSKGGSRSGVVPDECLLRGTPVSTRSATAVADTPSSCL
jgi:hypothetical protein